MTQVCLYTRPNTMPFYTRLVTHILIQTEYGINLSCIQYILPVEFSYKVNVLNCSFVMFHMKLSVVYTGPTGRYVCVTHAPYSVGMSIVAGIKYLSMQ